MNDTPAQRDARFIAAVQELEDAANHLNDVWTEVDHTGAYYSVGYPFAGSFDDQARNITNWLRALQDGFGAQCRMEYDEDAPPCC